MAESNGMCSIEAEESNMDATGHDLQKRRLTIKGKNLKDCRAQFDQLWKKGDKHG